MTEEQKQVNDIMMLGLVNAACEIIERVASGKDTTPELVSMASEWLTRASDTRDEIGIADPQMPETGELQIGQVVYRQNDIGMRHLGKIVALEDGSVLVDELQGRVEYDLGQIGIDALTEEQSEWMLKQRKSRRAE